MSRKQSLVLGLLLLGGLIAGGATYLCWDDLFPPPPGINPRTFGRLRVGMPATDVKNVLGQPWTPLVSGGWVGSTGFQFWPGEEYFIVIYYDLDGKITDGRCKKGDADVCPSLADRDLLGRFRRWFGY